MLRTGRIHIHIDSPHYGGDYLAETARVAEILATNTRRELLADCRDYWPEIYRTPGARANLRTFPSFVLAIMLVQL